MRVAPGAYVARAAWRALAPLDRHAQLVWEQTARLAPGQVVSHFAAAALHGIDILGAWPRTVDVSIPAATGGRSTGGVRRRAREAAEIETIAWGRHLVTTPLRTAVDLTASLPFCDGVVVADQALWRRRIGGPLVTHDLLREAAHSVTGRGSARAPRAAEFATDLADSVRESQSRVLIQVMGFPDPELQARFVLAGGREAFTDFFWRQHQHIGELDGVGKYLDPRLRAGRTPEQVLLAEKDREDELRRQVRAFSRWRTPALDSPRVLYDILTRAGLPSDRPRPGR